MLDKIEDSITVAQSKIIELIKSDLNMLPPLYTTIVFYRLILSDLQQLLFPDEKNQ